MNQAIHEIPPDDDDSDDIICTGHIPPPPGQPIDLTDTTVVDPDEVTVTDTIEPPTLTFETLWSRQREITRGLESIATTARIFRNLDVPSTRKRKRRM